MDNELKEFYEDIVACLIEYGKVKEEFARELVDKSKLCECATDSAKNLLFHETPYYWALWLLYSPSNPEWYQDPNLWPPPKDYLNKWYGQ